MLTYQYRGPGRLTGHCSNPSTDRPEQSHRRCPWVGQYRPGEWYTCPCDCHGTPDRETVEQTIASKIEAKETKMAAASKQDPKPKAKSTPEPRDCVCGCGEQTKGGKFKPGHDGRLKGQLIREYREASSKRDRERVAARFREHGWDNHIPADE